MHFLRRSHGYFLAFLLLFSVVPEWSFSQGFCVQSSDFPGSPRTRCMAETSGHKGYLFCGFIAGGFYINDVWEYDELTAQWTQKDTFPGPSRREAFTWSINGKIYLGCGNRGANCYRDLWQYDPATDSWLQRTDFPGNNWNQYAAFTYNGKGYIVFGYSNCGSSSSSTQFWEYDPQTDNWNQLADAPFVSIVSRGSVLGDKVYFLDASGAWTYSYDFTTQTWSNSWPNAAGSGTGAPVFSTTIQGVVHCFTENFVKYAHLPSASWLRGTNLHNNLFHSETAFMAFADSVKIIGGGTGLSAFTQDVWTYYPGCASTITAAITGPDTSYVGARNPLLNSSSIAPTTSQFLYHWRVDTADWGWFSGDTAVVAFRYGTVPVSMVATNGYCYDSIATGVHIAQGMWSGKTTLPLEAKGRNFAVGAGNAGVAYFGLGNDEDNNLLRDFWRYDCNSQRLERLPDFPFSPVHYGKFIHAAGHYYLLGGDTNVAPWKTNLFYEFIPATGGWNRLPDFPGPARAFAVATVINDQVYLGFGGAAELYRYDIPTSTWTQLATHPTLSFADALVDYQGDLYSVQVSGTGSIWKYDVSLDSWGLLTGNFTPDNRAGAVIFLDGSKVWVVNGKVSGTSPLSYLNTGYYFDLLTGLRSPAASLFSSTGTTNTTAFATGMKIDGRFYYCFGQFLSSKSTAICRYEQLACTTLPYYIPVEIDEAGIGVPHVFSNYSFLQLPEDTSQLSLLVDGLSVTPVNGFETTLEHTFRQCGEHQLRFIVTGSGCADTTTYYQTAHPIYNVESRAEMPLGQYNIRHTMNAFSIGNTGYMGMGNKYVDILVEAYKDWYAYDPATDTWSVRASLPAADDRTGSACFANNNYGYISSGNKGCFGSMSCYFNETWKYDPALDVWTQQSPIPGIGRYELCATVLGDTAYAGLGYYPFNNPGQIDKYSFSSDTWTSSGWPYGKSGSATPVAFTWNGKVYAGYNVLMDGGPYPGLYAYDPATGEWSDELLEWEELRGEPFAAVVGDEAFLFREYVRKIDLQRMKVIPLQTLVMPGDTSVDFSAGFTINNQVFFSTLTYDQGPRFGNHFYRYDIGQPVCDLDSLIMGTPVVVAKQTYSLEVQPNPAHERVLVTLSKDRNRSGLLELVDLQGRTLRSNRVQGINIAMQLAGVQPGVYTLSFTEEQTAVRSVAKLVVE
ncbi:MAG: Kelch repeat-containing protein [Bacteroidota bacterium]